MRGFRIEIGEVESALARVPDVDAAAVVVAERGGQAGQLVAFYSGEREVPEEELRVLLGDSLPDYMVPAAFHRRERLPVTDNGKLDRKALGALARELDAKGEAVDAPATPSEHRVAAAWATVLGISQDEIGRRDSFFGRGGTSLSAVKLVIALDRQVSLKDVTRLPVLADQARLVDGGPAGRSGLLQTLSNTGGSRAGALVCFPYAGGNAVNFQPLAGALRGSGLDVYAVELPGHDVAAENEPFAPLTQVAGQVVDEITSRGLTGIMLWGHSSGAALAVETARRLEDLGVDVERLFLAAHLPGDANERRAAASELSGRSDAELAAWLSADSGYTELGELDAQRAEHVGAAYRHDCVSAHRYFADALESPPAERLSAPVTVVVAADDPATAGFESRHRDWQVVAKRIDLHELAGGGHYFLRTRPAEAAQAVWHATREMTLS